MRNRLSLVLGVALLLGRSTTALAHLQRTRLDNSNPGIDLDLKRAWVDHDSEFIYSFVRTYGGFTNRALRDNAIRLELWRGRRRVRHFYVHVFSQYGSLRARVFRRDRNEEQATRVGRAIVDRLDLTRLRFVCGDLLSMPQQAHAGGC